MMSATSRRPPRGAGWPALAAGLAALALYAATLAPGLTWAHHGADGGDLLSAALTGGVPHPPGYPTYQLLLRAVLAASPAAPDRAGNWFSAVCAAGAAAALADLARRMLARGWPDAPQVRIGLCAVAAALAWAASPALWGQAVITEVYALHALAVVGILWLAWRWRDALEAGGAGSGWLAAAGLVLGLGLGNHLSLAFAGLALLDWIWEHRRQAAGAAGRQWLWAAGAVLLGLSTYAYLPIAAAGNPPINWGDPSTLRGFWWTVSGRAYGGLVMGIAPADLPARLSAWAGEALRQVGGGPWGTPVALAGLWWLDRRQHAWWRTTLLVAVAYSVYAIGYRTDDSFVYLIPVWGMAALWLAAGTAWAVEGAANWLARRGPGAARWRALPTLLAILALIVLPGASAVRFWPENDLSRDHEAADFAANALAAAEPGGVILSSTDRPTFALWYAVYGRGQRPDLVPLNVNLYYHFDWYRATLASRHPDLFAPEGGQPPVLEVLLPVLAARRPLYRAETVAVELPAFAEEPAGVLVRLRAP